MNHLDLIANGLGDNIRPRQNDLDGINPEQIAEYIRAIANLTGEQMRGMTTWASDHEDHAVFEQAIYLLDHRRDNGYGLPADWSERRADRPVSTADDPLADLFLTPAEADPDAPPCLDCRIPLPFNVTAYAVDGGGVCGPCGIKRYGDRAGEYLINEGYPVPQQG